MFDEWHTRRPGDVRLQVERGGVRRTLKGVLRSSAGRIRRRFKGHLLVSGQRLLPFFGGLLLATVYGFATLLLANRPLWFSVHITLPIAGLAAFGMGVSANVRANVAVLVPSLCASRGRNFLHLLFISMLISGPLSNIMKNTEQAASSLLCSAELAANQTQELLHRSSQPLYAVLDKIEAITNNAHAIAARVKDFMSTLMDGVHHIAHAMRNVLHFLAHIGDVCNEKMGAPYKKCRGMFIKARNNCNALLKDFRFLCKIVNGFMWLCEIARVAELFCIIPSYIGEHLKQRLADPVIAVFLKLKQEFEFNISATMSFNMESNSSQTLQDVMQGIMSEVSADLEVFKQLADPLAYGVVAVLAWSYFRAVQYRHRYLERIYFDNHYITDQFRELNDRVCSMGKPSLLPLTRREANTFIRPLSWKLSVRERKAVYVALVSALKYLLVGSVLVALDFLVFWILDQVTHQLKGDIVARAPVSVKVVVNGSGYASDIYRDLASSFDVLQQGNVTVISSSCQMAPIEPDYTTCFNLGFVIGLSLLLSLTGGFIMRSRRLICASFYPEREQERIQFLRQRIMRRRKALGKALWRSAVRGRRRRGGDGEGCCATLLAWLPGGDRVSHTFRLTPPVVCLCCGEGLRQKDANTVTCGVKNCPAVYCRSCFQTLGNMCVMCRRRLSWVERRVGEQDAAGRRRASSIGHRDGSKVTRATNIHASRLPDSGSSSMGDSEAESDPDNLSEGDLAYQRQSPSSSPDPVAVQVHSPP